MRDASSTSAGAGAVAEASARDEVDPIAALGSKLSRPVSGHTAVWTIGVAALFFTMLGQLAC